MNTHALAADIVSRVHHSADNPLNLAAVVEGLIAEHGRDSQRATVQALTDSSAALVEVMTRYEELVKTLLEAKKAGVGL